MNSHVFVITGAGRGIGLELTRRALENGAEVYAGVRKPNEAAALQRLKTESSKPLTILQLDVDQDESTRAFAKALANSAGHIDVLINNAGIFRDREGAACSTSADIYRESLETNALGPMRVTSTCLSLLKKSKQTPIVVNITSKMGSIADNESGGSPAYRMSKTALNSFTKSLSIDERELIVLSIHPGWVRTEMGGASAPLAVEASASGIMAIIKNATTSQSGHFLNYDGKELPW